MKSKIKKQISYINAFIETRKIALMILLAESNRVSDIEKTLADTTREG